MNSIYYLKCILGESCKNQSVPSIQLASHRVCVCVKESEIKRERERKMAREREREREIKRERKRETDKQTEICLRIGWHE